jgi:hypothetical protein
MTFSNLQKFIFVALASLQLAHAEGEEPKKVAKERVIVEGSAAASRSDQKKSSYLTRAEGQVQDELTRLQQKLSIAQDPCEKDELKARIQSAEFLKTHAQQIQEILDQVAESKRTAKGILLGVKRGRVDPCTPETYLDSRGVEDTSCILVIQDLTEGQKLQEKRVPIKALYQYIEKYESEVAKLSGDKKKISALVAQLRRPERATDPDWFGLTLDQALSAYLGPLNTFFEAGSERAMYAYRLILGPLTSVFSISTKTRLGFDPKYRNFVSSKLLKPGESANASIATELGFGEFLEELEEGRVWESIRRSQITLSGVPLDGKLRQEHFESMRTLECRVTKGYVFSDSIPPGPFVSEAEKEPCRFTHQIHILQSSLRYRYSDSKTPIDTTTWLREEMAGRDSVYSPNGFRGYITSQGFGSCADVELFIRYVCGCGPIIQEKSLKFKVGSPVSFGC